MPERHDMHQEPEGCNFVITQVRLSLPARMSPCPRRVLTASRRSFLPAKQTLSSSPHREAPRCWCWHILDTTHRCWNIKEITRSKRLFREGKMIRNYTTDLFASCPALPKLSLNGPSDVGLERTKCCQVPELQNGTKLFHFCFLQTGVSRVQQEKQPHMPARCQLQVSG